MIVTDLMSFSVTLKPSDKNFSLEADQFILQAALKQNIVLPYGCKDGACGSCKAKIVSGTIEQGPHSAGALRQEEKDQGMALLCCSKACSDLVIEARVLAAMGDIPIKKMPCRVASVERVAPDVAILKLQLPAAEKLLYLAGQYVEIIMRDGTRRQYSMGCAPHLAEQLELHVRHMPGGKFTDSLFGASAPAIKERDILRFEGPLGTFFLREDSDKPIVLLASGTGFAPIKAVIEHSFLKSMQRPMTLYWGGRRPQDLYMHQLCLQWAAEHHHFSYVPVVSDALPEDGWQGRNGFVHKAVIADFPDLSGYQVYACGAPIVVDSAQKEFIGMCGLPGEEFFADSFVTAADTAKLNA
jgi:CDP-4-dehydro-6-deoxyglucose reductase, E3